MTKRILVLIITVLVFSLCLNAGEVNFKGFSQTWFAIADSHSNDASAYGFTFKRVHLFPYGTLGKKIKWLIHVGYEGQPSIKLIDAFIDFDLSTTSQLPISPTCKISSTSLKKSRILSSIWECVSERSPIFVIYLKFSNEFPNTF